MVKTRLGNRTRRRRRRRGKWKGRSKGIDGERADENDVTHEVHLESPVDYCCYCDLRHDDHPTRGFPTRTYAPSHSLTHFQPLTVSLFLSLLSRAPFLSISLRRAPFRCHSDRVSHINCRLGTGSGMQQGCVNGLTGRNAVHTYGGALNDTRAMSLFLQCAYIDVARTFT